MVENQQTEEEVVENQVADKTAQPEAVQSESAAGGSTAAAPVYTGFKGRLDNFFGISKMGSNFKTEILAGLTTFMTMVYILFVNADFFTAVGGSGVTKEGAYVFTALSAIVGTLLMTFLAKLPFAQAAGMGLNTFFCFTICGTYGFSYGNALLIVLCSGFLFLLLTIIGARQAIVRAVPEAIRLGIPAGIGLFIAFIGLQQAGVVIANSGTIVGLLSFNLVDRTTDALALISALIALLTLMLIAILSKLKVKGSVFFGIVGGTILYYILAGIGAGAGSSTCKAMFEAIKFTNPGEAFVNFGKESIGQVFISGFTGISGSQIFSFIAAMISFAMVDMFDTIGTLMGTCQAAGKESGLIDENGEVKNIQKALLCDSIATCTGAILGCSTITTFVESSSGVAEGGRTGFTSLVVSVLFFIAMFLSPLATLIPRSATAGALLYVGVLMLGGIKNLDWKDPAVAIPAFLTIIMMPFTYSISYGIGFGFVSYTIIKLCTGKWRDISIVTAILTVFFILNFILFPH